MRQRRGENVIHSVEQFNHRGESYEPRQRPPAVRCFTKGGFKKSSLKIGKKAKSKGLGFSWSTSKDIHAFSQIVASVDNSHGERVT